MLNFLPARTFPFAAGLGLSGSLLTGLPTLAQTAPTTLMVQVNKPGAPIAKTMYGLFFEDINFAADGGLYPELDKNKSFELDEHLLGWRGIRGAAALSTYTVSSQQPISATNNHFLRMTAAKARPAALSRNRELERDMVGGNLVVLLLLGGHAERSKASRLWE